MVELDTVRREWTLTDAEDNAVATADAATDPARTELPTLVGKALRAADALPPGHDRDEHLHEMRKAAKRLRYATEVAAPALGTNAKGLVKRVKAVQELLDNPHRMVPSASGRASMGPGVGVRPGGIALGILVRLTDLHHAISALTARASAAADLDPDSTPAALVGRALQPARSDQLPHQYKAGSGKCHDEAEAPPWKVDRPYAWW